MRDEYYTNEKDYRPDEEPFDGTDFRYQNMSRDPENAPKVGSEFDEGYANPANIDHGTSPFSTGSQYGGNQTLDSQSFETTADRMYANYGRNGGKGPKNYRRSKERIHEEVCEALMWNEDLDASDIEVKVEDNGEVTLEGEVSHRNTKRLAENLAEAVRGVMDVHNRLRIRREASSETGEKTKAAPETITRKERADRNPDNVKH